MSNGACPLLHAGEVTVNIQISLIDNFTMFFFRNPGLKYAEKNQNLLGFFYTKSVK